VSDLLYEPLVAPPARNRSACASRLAAISARWLWPVTPTRAGTGIAFQPGFIVDDDLAAARLVRVLRDWQSPDMGVYAVYPSCKHLSAKVRTFVDLLAAELAG